MFCALKDSSLFNRTAISFTGGDRMSASTYTVFIIHPLVIVFLALFFRNVRVFPLFKFLLLAPLALVICFVLAHFIRLIPGLKRVL